MANFKGEGAMTQRQLLVTSFDSNVTKNGKTRFLDVQLAASDPLAKDQTNLHCVSQQEKNADGTPKMRVDQRTGESKESWSNHAAYTVDQYEKIKEAALSGDNANGPTVGKFDNGREVISIVADVMPRSGSNKGVVINTSKPMQPGPAIGPDVIDKQIDSTRSAREARDAAKKANQAQAPQAQQQNQGQVASFGPAIGRDEAANDGPSFG